MTDSRRAFLVGYFGHGNAGDEWISAALRRRFPEVFDAVLSGPRGNGGTEIVPWNRPAALWRALRRCRAVVLGGGELFQVRSSLRSLFYYLAILWVARRLRLPIAAFGVSLDPSLPRWASRAVARALAGCDVWARDPRSAEALVRSRIRGQAVDAVWSLDARPGPRPDRLRRVLWVVRGPDDLSSVARSLNALRAVAGWDHALVAFHPARDVEALAGLRARLDFPHEVETWDRPDDLFETMRRADIVVSMRFHGLIAGTLAGRPVAALSGYGKVERLAETIGAPILFPGSGGESWARTIRGAFVRGPVPADRWVQEARAGLDGLGRWLASAVDLAPSEKL